MWPKVLTCFRAFDFNCKLKMSRVVLEKMTDNKKIKIKINREREGEIAEEWMERFRAFSSMEKVEIFLHHTENTNLRRMGSVIRNEINIRS